MTFQAFFEVLVLGLFLWCLLHLVILVFEMGSNIIARVTNKLISYIKSDHGESSSAVKVIGISYNLNKVHVSEVQKKNDGQVKYFQSEYNIQDQDPKVWRNVQRYLQKARKKSQGTGKIKMAKIIKL